jgi:hypothetical protein
MKWFSGILLVLICCKLSAQEYLLFDANKKPSAYLYAENKHLIFYNFNGSPLAKLENYEDEDYAVFGKNGLHIGWYSEGWLYDLDGKIVGFLEGAMKTKKYRVAIEKVRDRFQFEGYKEPARIKSFLEHKWSNLSLKSFFERGLSPSPYPNNYLFENKTERKTHKI